MMTNAQQFVVSLIYVRQEGSQMVVKDRLFILTISPPSEETALGAALKEIASDPKIKGFLLLSHAVLKVPPMDVR